MQIYRMHIIFLLYRYINTLNHIYSINLTITSKSCGLTFIPDDYHCYSHHVQIQGNLANHHPVAVPHNPPHSGRIWSYPKVFVSVSPDNAKRSDPLIGDCKDKMTVSFPEFFPRNESDLLLIFFRRLYTVAVDATIGGYRSIGYRWSAIDMFDHLHLFLLAVSDE